MVTKTYGCSQNYSGRAYMAGTQAQRERNHKIRRSSHDGLILSCLESFAEYDTLLST